jgi:hypothetical protein
MQNPTPADAPFSCWRSTCGILIGPKTQRNSWPRTSLWSRAPPHPSWVNDRWSPPQASCHPCCYRTVDKDTFLGQALIQHLHQGENLWFLKVKAATASKGLRSSKRIYCQALYHPHVSHKCLNHTHRSVTRKRIRNLSSWWLTLINRGKQFHEFPSPNLRPIRGPSAGSTSHVRMSTVQDKSCEEARASHGVKVW